MLDTVSKDLLDLEKDESLDAEWKQHTQKNGVTIHYKKWNGYNCVRGEMVMPHNIQVIYGQLKSLDTKVKLDDMFEGGRIVQDINEFFSYQY